MVPSIDSFRCSPTKLAGRRRISGAVLERVVGSADRKKGAMMEIEMKIRTIMMDPDANTPVVVLKDVSSETMLPIWIGAFEANAIAVEIAKDSAQRPTTHDLIKNIIRELGVSVRRVVITDLVDNTFFAVIEMVKDGETLIIDSRPSDAIAVALRVDCPIYVNQQVINSSAATTIEEDTSSGDDEWPDDLVDDAPHYKM